MLYSEQCNNFVSIKISDLEFITYVVSVSMYYYISLTESVWVLCRCSINYNEQKNSLTYNCFYCWAEKKLNYSSINLTYSTFGFRYYKIKQLFIYNFDWLNILVNKENPSNVTEIENHEAINVIVKLCC